MGAIYDFIQNFFQNSNFANINTMNTSLINMFMHGSIQFCNNKDLARRLKIMKVFLSVKVPDIKSLRGEQNISISHLRLIGA